jgi:Protein of unknown function (DUF982)
MQGIGNTRFARPVTIRLKRSSQDQIVVDASHAGRILMHEWPRKDSAKRQAAMDACLRVLRGEALSPIARRAFVAAAMEAHILAAD